MRVLVTAATRFELDATLTAWPAGQHGAALTVAYLVTGVGPVHAGVLLTESILAQRPDLILNLGVAGALDASLRLGEVVHVVREEWGDLGVEERDGTFTDVQQLRLLDPEEPPYSGGYLAVPDGTPFARQVTGVTVSTVHGSAAGIAALRGRTDAQVETMEGGAIFLVALRQNLPCVQLRAISNYVAPRDRDAWEIPLALDNLGAAASRLLAALAGAPASARPAGTPPRGR